LFVDPTVQNSTATKLSEARINKVRAGLLLLDFRKHNGKLFKALYLEAKRDFRKELLGVLNDTKLGDEVNATLHGVLVSTIASLLRDFDAHKEFLDMLRRDLFSFESSTGQLSEVRESFNSFIETQKPPKKPRRVLRNGYFPVENDDSENSGAERRSFNRFPQERANKKTRKYWKLYVLSESVRYVFRPMRYLAGTAGLVMGVFGCIFGIVAARFQDKQGRQQKKLDTAESVVTRARGVLHFLADSTAFLFVLQITTWIGVAASGVSLLSEVVGLYKIGRDLRSNWRKLSEIFKTGKASWSFSQLKQYTFLKWEQWGQVLNGFARLHGIAANVMVIVMVSMGATSLAALLATPVGWGIVGALIVGGLLYWASNAIRLHAKRSQKLA